MSIAEDGPQPARVRHSLNHLRELLQKAREAGAAERVHAALIDAVEGLITQAERQARLIEDMRSSFDHEPDVAASVGSGELARPVADGPLRAFTSSSNGDRWFLGRDEASGVAHVIHKANLPSGGAVTNIELSVFLNRGPSAPETLGLLRLIGGLAG